MTPERAWTLRRTTVQAFASSGRGRKDRFESRDWLAGYRWRNPKSISRADLWKADTGLLPLNRVSLYHPERF
tara:strand:- start:285 stop:500 length:216 start_codon:yes stop_codon:yes gene_type:complete